MRGTPAGMLSRRWTDTIIHHAACAPPSYPVLKRLAFRGFAVLSFYVLTTNPVTDSFVLFPKTANGSPTGRFSN